jgi:hypothetical protein
VTDDNSGEMWTKGPANFKTVEATHLWNVLEDGVNDFMAWVNENSWSWSDADTLFDKFKIWLADTVGDFATLEDKNAIYAGLAQQVADMERGATMARLGKNFDEGKAMVGAENVLPNGYSDVPDTLADMIREFPNCKIRLNKKVIKIVTWGKRDEGTIMSNDMVNGGASYSAPRIIVSVPLGVLKHGTIAFDPELSADKATAIAKLGMGLLDKVTLLYSENFWRDDANELGESTWFEVVDPTADPVGEEPHKPQREFFNAARYLDNKPVVTMLYGADTADEYEMLSDDELVNITDSLFRSLWTGESDAVVSSSLITRWRADEHARGSYSYLPPGANVGMRITLCAHLGDGIFWAGEHCSVDWPATVNGAFESGAQASMAAIAFDTYKSGALHSRMTLVAIPWAVSIASLCF